MKSIASCVMLLAAWPCGAQTEAENLIEAGHWKRARAVVEANVRQPHDGLTQFLLSQIHNAFGDHESPLALAEKAVDLDGSVAKYHRQVAEVTGVMAQHAGFLQQFILARRFRHEIDTAISLDAHDVQALRDLMEFYRLAPGIAGGDRERARETAARIARLGAVQGYVAQARLAEAAAEPSREEAMLRQAVETGPAHYRASVALSAFLLTHGNWEAARQQATLAAKIDGLRVDAYVVLAAADAHLDRMSELESLLATAEKQVPDDLSPYFRAGEVLWELGQNLARAQRYFRRYLAAEPEGNASTLSDARGKLEQVVAKTRASGRTHGNDQ